MREFVSMKSPKDGEKIWLSAESILFNEPTSDEPSIYTIAQNVTELVETRDRAEDALAQLMLLQQLANVGFWSLDIQEESLYWSDEVYRIHGKDPAKYAPKLSQGVDFYHPEDRQKVLDELKRVRTEGGQFHFKLRIINDGGETVPVESFGLARMDATGHVGRIIGVFRALN